MLPDPDHARLQDLIYNAVIEPVLWEKALVEVMALVGAEAGGVSRLSIVDGGGSMIVVSPTKERLPEYYSYYAERNVIVRVADRSNYARDWTPRILRDEDTLPREELERSEFYNDFLLPGSAAWAINVRLGLHGDYVSTIDLGRAYGAGRFEDEEVAVIRRLHPHLLRAHALSRRFASLHGLSAALLERLDQSTEGMLLLDRDGRVLHANMVGDRLLSAGDPLHLVGGRVTARDGRSACALAESIKAGADTNWNDRKGSAIVLRSRHGAPATVSVTPLRGAEASVFADGAPVLVTVAEPQRRACLSHDRLIELFGLTRAEARLADALFAGLSLRDASSRHGISFNTARAQLASVFSKTDTHRQVDLVRVLEAVQTLC